MKVIREFLSESKSRYSELSYGHIKEALRTAIKLLGEKKRYNGDNFILHSLGVADIAMRDMRLDETTVIAAILHDVARFKLMSNEEISKLFGASVAEVLFGMNNISDVHTNMESDQVEYFKDMIISYSTNPRVILLKVADRTEVMRSLEDFPPAKRAKKSWESLYIYSQIAHKLGYYNLKSEMEDLALKYLEPEDYISIKTSLENSEKEREKFIHSFIEPINKEMIHRGIRHFKIKGRTKSIYSIWRKMVKQKISFEEVYDVFAIRIIIDCELTEEKAQCWNVFSIVTNAYQPNPRRMRDWISVPKSNGYESLHTTVVTKAGRWVEVQIRTHRMDDVAENGLAAHWRYKGVQGGEESTQEWLDRLRTVIDDMDVQEDTLHLDKDLTQDNKEVFVFTPTGDIKRLKSGATILDFAYEIHSNVGNNCISGRINHKSATIRDKLSNGDLVEIITSKNQVPRPDWLKIVVTSKAKSRIKAFLREAEQKEYMIRKEELERKIKNWKLPIEFDMAVNVLCKTLKLKNGAELYRMIALGEISMTKIKNLIQRHLAGDSDKNTEERAAPKAPKEEPQSTKDMLIVGNDVRGIQYKFAQCCSPLFGDEIFGFVTILNGITIHRKDCVNGKEMMKKYPYRVIDAEWKGSEKVGKRELVINVSSAKAISSDAMMEIAQRIGIELRSITHEYLQDKVRSTIKVNLPDTVPVDTVTYMVRQIDGVETVQV